MANCHDPECTTALLREAIRLMRHLGAVGCCDECEAFLSRPEIQALRKDGQE